MFEDGVRFFSCATRDKDIRVPLHKVHLVLAKNNNHGLTALYKKNKLFRWASKQEVDFLVGEKKKPVESYELVKKMFDKKLKDTKSSGHTARGRSYSPTHSRHSKNHSLSRSRSRSRSRSHSRDSSCDSSVCSRDSSRAQLRSRRR